MSASTISPPTTVTKREHKLIRPNVHPFDLIDNMVEAFRKLSYSLRSSITLDMPVESKRHGNDSSRTPGDIICYWVYIQDHKDPLWNQWRNVKRHENVVKMLKRKCQDQDGHEDDLNKSCHDQHSNDINTYKIYNNEHKDVRMELFKADVKLFEEEIKYLKLEQSFYEAGINVCQAWITRLSVRQHQVKSCEILATLELKNEYVSSLNELKGIEKDVTMDQDIRQQELESYIGLCANSKALEVPTSQPVILTSVSVR